MIRRVALVGPGRAGGAVCLALTRQGASVVSVAGRTPDTSSTQSVALRFAAAPVPVGAAGAGVDLVVLSPPDDALAEVVSAVAPGVERGTVVLHLSGAHGLGVLGPIAVRPEVAVGALHPLQSLPSIDVGADRLAGAWAAVAGPSAIGDLAATLGMHPFAVADEHRARYHAAACVASNHLVALLGQVQRLAAAAGVPQEAFEPLVRTTLEHAMTLGPADALTGPVSRGDVATIAAHLAAIPSEERRAYAAMADAARVLIGRGDPGLVEVLARGDEA